MKKILISFLIIFVFAVSSCKKDEKFNIFTIQDDIQLGREITDEILANPDDYNVLDKDEYAEAYNYLYGLRDKLLVSENLRYASDFDWDIYIIDEDVLNAFAVPGGNTFYYTGLINYLDNEASLMGVMAHEFAHCDRRHSTARLTKMYGFQILISIVIGNNPTVAAEIAANLALGLTSLQFSREDEYEADEYAVKYVYPTETDSRGVAYFFEKMELEEGQEWMRYFSTHPHPSDRIEKIYQHWTNNGAKEGNLFEDRYDNFKSIFE
jgi:beta-barrel assembly-enhancing protease